MIHQPRGGRREIGALFVMQEWSKKFYSSKTWQKTRKAYKQSVGGLCERCLAKGLIKPGVIVHHKKWLSPERIKDPEYSLNWNNLELVCRECHEAIHKNMLRYEFDEDGKVILH